MFLDLSVLCLLLVVAKLFLAPSLKISHETLMGLRPYSRASREIFFFLWVGLGFFPLIRSSPHISLAAQLLRP